MIPKVDFTYTDGSETVLSAAQGVSIDAFPTAKERFENTISELTKERDGLKGRVSSLKAQLEETENGLAEALRAAVQEAVSQIKRELLGVIAAQGSEIIELKKAVAPVIAKLEAERIAQEKHQQERKEAALHMFDILSGWDLTIQVEHIRSMNPEEIEYIHHERSKIGTGLMRRMSREQWTKERMLQPWV